MKLTIRVDQERVGEEMTVAEYMGAMNGDQKALVALATKMLWDEDTGEYYTPEVARKIIGGLKVKQLRELINALLNETEELAVPNESEGAYE